MSQAAEFLARHRSGPGFILPNAWDAGSAIVLAAAGFPAIATTSSGIAFSLGRQDYQVDRDSCRVSREAMFGRMKEIVDAVSVPVSGDLEAGYGDSPDAVADTIRSAIEIGLAGGNIEDRIPGMDALYDESLAVERIQAARETINASKRPFVLTARSDAILHEVDGIQAAIHRSNLYRRAGADCLFTPGVSDLSNVTRLAREIDGPLNMVLGLGTNVGNAKEWIAAGVRRVSLGGSIARSALGLVQCAARELLDNGTIGFAEQQLPQSALNTLFAKPPPCGAF